MLRVPCRSDPASNPHGRFSLHRLVPEARLTCARLWPQGSHNSRAASVSVATSALTSQLRGSGRSGQALVLGLFTLRAIACRGQSLDENAVESFRPHHVQTEVRRIFGHRARAALLAGCALPGRVAEPTGMGPTEAREAIVRLLPPNTDDRAGWAADIHAALATLELPSTPENLCAVLAVTEQESGFRADPAVPGLRGDRPEGDRPPRRERRRAEARGARRARRCRRRTAAATPSASTR